MSEKDKKLKVAFFDSKDYDIESFEEAEQAKKFKIKYFDTKLTEDTAKLAKGYDVVCVFVNDTVDEKVINSLAKKGVKLVALRCAGFNNVDVKAASGKLGVVRV
ncbi:MAG: 2-hydroxyacid dehydrogenase, partial [Lachnospiraceae bacterium]|nr:2-hydroxyacid dehydrogenase [Lachnospiraceae bacterium]